MPIDPPSSPSSQPSRRSSIADPYFWAICAIGVLAALLRFYGLGSESIWGDEAATWLQSRGSLVEVFIRTAHDNYPPLYNLLVWICIRIFGDAEWSLRLPAALLGTANVLAIYWVGTLFGNRLAGIFAAVLLCLSGFHIAYSQEARMYALLACMATLFAGTSWRMVHTPSAKWTVLSTLAGSGLLYSHLYGAFTWAAIAFGFGALLFFKPPGWKLSLSRFIRVQIWTLVAYAPWALVLLGRALWLGHHGYWIPEVTGHCIWRALIAVSSGFTTFSILLAGLLFAYWPQNFVPIQKGAVRTGFSDPALAYRPQKRQIPGPDTGGAAEPHSASEPRTRALWILSLWAAGPVAAGVVISLVTVPILIPRYLIGSLPPILILASIGFARIASDRWALAAVAAVVLVAGSTGAVSGGGPKRPDWRGVGKLMEAQLGPDDCVVIYRAVASRVFPYYYDREIPCLVKVHTGSAGDVDPAAIVSDRVFLVFWTGDPEAYEMIEPLSRTRADMKVFRLKGARVIRLAKGQP